MGLEDSVSSLLHILFFYSTVTATLLRADCDIGLTACSNMYFFKVIIFLPTDSEFNLSRACSQLSLR